MTEFNPDIDNVDSEQEAQIMEFTGDYEDLLKFLVGGQTRSIRQQSVDQMVDTIAMVADLLRKQTDGIVSGEEAANMTIQVNFQALAHLGVTVEEIATAMEHSPFYDDSGANVLREANRK